MRLRLCRILIGIPSRFITDARITERMVGTLVTNKRLQGAKIRGYMLVKHALE